MKKISAAIFLLLVTLNACVEQDPPKPQPTTQWTTYRSMDGLAGNEVNMVFVDSENNKWFGTQYGLSVFDGAGWENYTPGNGLIYQEVLAVAEDQQGVMWIGTPFGVSRFDGTNWISYTQTDGLSDSYVYDIAVDQNNTKWFATANGVSSYDGNSWRVYFKQSDTALVHNHVRCVEVDVNGALWFGTEFGISKKTSSGWTSYISSEGNLWNYIIDADVDLATNTLWFSTLAGASAFTPQEEWSYISYGDGIAYNQVYGVAFHNNQTWFATQRGISLLQEGQWTSYTAADGLAADWATDIEVDHSGLVWTTTYPGGVSSLLFESP